MLFSSVTFLFLFLPILFIFLAISDKKYHNIILLLASIIFYAFGEPKFLWIIFSVILISYTGAFLINACKKYRKIFLFFTIAGNLGFLLYFKYFNFFINIFNNITKAEISFVEIILPLGISFYTFQALSYVIDVYRKNVKVQRNLYKFALYIFLFPQLIAGPIIKYHDIEGAIESREITFEAVTYGVKRFIIGLAKKMIIANTMGGVAFAVFQLSPNHLSHFQTWLGAIAYTLQIFFDFSGYSDMAIGIGMIFGFKFMENFNYPYISKSITEFWRRWHISLSTWFKEYVYIPLGGNKKGKLTTVRNLGIVFLLTGFWHGAGWNFIIWGLWHGCFVIIEKMINIKTLEIKYNKNWQKFLMHIYCMLVVIIGWVLFNSPDIKYAYNYIQNMFWIMPDNTINQSYTIHYYGDTKEFLVFLIAFLCSTPIFTNILNVKNNFGKVFVNVYLIAIFILSIMIISVESYNPFIYFRF